MESPRQLSYEKNILRHWLSESRTIPEAAALGPCKHENPVRDAEQRFGRFRSPDSKISVTAEIAVINEYQRRDVRSPAFIEAGPRRKLYFLAEDVRVGIVTPGGVAPGLNTVIHSIVNMHMHRDLYACRHKVLGFRGGFRGLAENICDELDFETTKSWLHRGGTELGTTRDEPRVEKWAETLADRGIDILYVVGGDGSLKGAHALVKEIKRRGEERVVAGVPKTMDNDILWVWHSFGFDTTVEEATRAVNSIRDDTKSTERICLMQLFGRDAGFVAAHAGLASGQVDAVLVPEVPFQIDLLLDYIEEQVTDNNHALLVVAEGAAPDEYTDGWVYDKIREVGLDPVKNRTDPRVNRLLASGKLEFLKEKFDEKFVSGPRSFHSGRHRVFVSEPRHLIRAVPPRADDQIYCQMLGDLVVHNALAGYTDFMISQWLTEYVLVPLEHVVGATKKIQPDGIFWAAVTSATGQPSFMS